MANKVENSQLLSFVGESSRPYKSMTLEEANKYMEDLYAVENGNMSIFNNNTKSIQIESQFELEFLNNKFISIMNESDGNIENNSEENKLVTIEEKKSSMVKSFKNRIQDNINTIKRVSARANDEAINMVVEDRKVFKSFSAALRVKKNLEGFIGIKDFVFPGDKFAIAVDTVINSTDSVVNIHKKYMNFILQANSVESMKNYYKSYCNEIITSVDNKNDTILHINLKPKAERWQPTMKDISNMLRFINNPSVITCSIADGCRHSVGNLAKICNNTYSIFNRITSESDLEIARMNYLYRCTSFANRKIGSLFIQFKDLTIREIAGYRKAVMITGKYANDKKEKKERSLKEWAILENNMSTSSDLYVYDRMS